MNLLESVIESIFEIIFKVIILGLLRGTGATAKWAWHRGQKPWGDLIDEDWNGRLGLLIVGSVIGLVMLLAGV